MTSSFWSFLSAFAAVSAVEISYCLGGVNVLDALVFLLVVSFLFFAFRLYQEFQLETRDYVAGLVIVAACVVFSLYAGGGFEVGSMDDNYHNCKIVALSIKNNFFTKFQYINDDGSNRFYLPELIESVWGVLWRYTQWDFWVNLTQALPILLLWRQLLVFFRNQGIITSSGFLAACVVLSIEVLWCSQGSTFIDSVAGLLGALGLLMCYDVLRFPSQRGLSSLARLAFVSGVCMSVKPSVLPIGVLGVLAALFLAFRSFDWRRAGLVVLAALPSIAYFLYFEIQSLLKKVNLLHPAVDAPAGTVYQGWYHYYYESSVLHLWVRDHLWNMKVFHIIAHWMEDLVPVHDLTPDPWIGGNGLLFAYAVLPILAASFIMGAKKYIDLKTYRNSALMIFAVTVAYYILFDGSVGARFTLAFNIFILAWCLAWLWRKVERLRAWAAIAGCIILFLATTSYLNALQGHGREKKLYSYLYAQRQLFPRFMETTDIRKFVLKQVKED